MSELSRIYVVVAIRTDGTEHPFPRPVRLPSGNFYRFANAGHALEMAGRMTAAAQLAGIDTEYDIQVGSDVVRGSA